MLGVAVVVLITLLAASVATVFGRSRHASVIVLITAAAWPLVNGRLEGPVLWTVGRGHGLALSDLLTPLALAAVAVRVVVRRREGRTSEACVLERR